MLLIVSACLIIALCLWKYLRSPKSNVKGLSFVRSFSCMMDFSKLPEILYEFCMNNKIEGFYSLWFGTTRFYGATDPDAAQWLLNLKEDSAVKTFFSLPSLRELSEGNIVVVDGEVWRRQRKVYNPAFNHEAYVKYFDSFNFTVDKCLHKLSNLMSSSGKDQDLDMLPLMSKFTLDLLGKSIFGYDFGSLDDKLDEYYSAYKTIFTFDKIRILYTFFPWLDYLPMPYSKRLRNAASSLRSLFQKMIKEHSKTGSPQNDMLMHMLNASNKQTDVYLTEQEFYANLWILFVAGHETTATALSWLFYEFAKNPEIQEKVYQEITNLLGDKPPTFEDLDKLEYLDKVIKEGMRVHPPVSTLPSRTTLTELKYKNQVIPKGSFIAINIYNIHFHPDHWKNPFTFDPDRWYNEKHHRFAYLPFSLGQRMCIGSNFSLIEQRLFLTKFLQQFEIQLPTTHQLSSKRGVALFTPQNVWVSLKPRKVAKV